MKSVIFKFVFTLYLFLAGSLFADTIQLYLFEQAGCPNCAEMKSFLKDIKNDFPEIQVTHYDIAEDTEAARLYNYITDVLEIRSPAVPLLLVGEYYYMGARENVLEEISFILSSYRIKPYEDRMGQILKRQIEDASSVKTTPVDLLHLPLIGDIRLGELSLIGSTALIAFVDGFNPCSLWVLTLVLGMALHARKRSQVFIIGAVFLLFTSIVYGGFLFGAVRVVSVLKFSFIFRIALIVFITFFAAINIKDYFFWKIGFSFTIGETGKNKIITALKRYMNPSLGIIPLAAGSMVLAISAALIELPCTAGFPVLWAQMLSRFEVSMTAFWGYLTVYLLVYLLDEIIVLAVAVITLRRQILNETKGRQLKLISGSLMLSIAVHLVFFQDLLRTGFGFLSVVAAAGISGVFMFVLYRILSKGRDE